MRRYLAAVGILALAVLAFGAVPARAGDSASLQLTVPAPDPVTAGDVLSLQALAVNTGSTTWVTGSYYWVAEIYDLEGELVARTDQVSPRADVNFGDVAAISLQFRVPDTLSGRRLYRMFLVKDAQLLITSQLKPFQVVKKPIPERQKYVDYRVEGNVTLSYKNSSREDWSEHKGATTINTVGKIKDSSYLLNTYLLHEPGDAFDPFIIVMNYYAPWGTIYGGDVTPILGPLSVNGQGLRGAMLEQEKGPYSWAVLGGQSITSEPGNRNSNGRYARSLYGLKVGREFGDKVKGNLVYFVSSDETGSLTTDPDSSNYRGPTLEPQRNRGVGLDFTYEPKKRLKLLAAYQQNTYFEDSAAPGEEDTAWRMEVKWDKTLFKLKSYIQRAGPEFRTFAAPAVVGDRLTIDNTFTLYPTDNYTASLMLTQHEDNLAADEEIDTTTQRVISMSHSLQLKKGTGLGASFSQHTAKAEPSGLPDSRTMTYGFNVSQVLGKHSGSMNVQMSQYSDANELVHDLDTQTVSVSANLSLPKRWNASAGITRSSTKDKADGTARSSLSFSPSVSFPIKPKWAGQVWGTMSTNKNTSEIAPTDKTTTSLNSEATWSRTQAMNLTFGAGYNKVDDKFDKDRSYNELTMSTRFSYSF
ncbi:hypothetical protein ACFL2T_07660 [Elusimicrobiota bacterium]